jgi:hypothetical protein
MRLREAVHPSRCAVMPLTALPYIEFILEKLMAALSQAWECSHPANEADPAS